MEETSRAFSHTIRFVGLLGSHALGSNPRFMATTIDLGRELVRRKIRLTYRGGNVGLQGAVASTVYNNGGRVRGFIPEYIAARQVYGPTYGVEYTVSSNYYKYFEMNHIVEAFIVLPGGIDTMEGLFTLISWASEGLHSKPIGLLNIDGYFNNLIKFLDDAVRQNFMALNQRKLFISSFFVDELLDKLEFAKAFPGPGANYDEFVNPGRYFSKEETFAIPSSSVHMSSFADVIGRFFIVVSLLCDFARQISFVIRDAISISIGIRAVELKILAPDHGRYGRRSLPKEYDMDVKVIRRSHNIKTMTLDALMGILESIELDMTEDNKRRKPEKQVAFTGTETEDDFEHDPTFDEEFQEQLSLFTKQFKKQWVQKRGGQRQEGTSKGPYVRESRFREPRAVENRDTQKKKGPLCFECGGYGHIQMDCANNLKKKRQAFSATWSDEESEEQSDFGAKPLDHHSVMSKTPDDRTCIGYYTQKRDNTKQDKIKFVKETEGSKIETAAPHIRGSQSETDLSDKKLNTKPEKIVKIGKSPKQIFVSSIASSFMTAISKKNILPQRNIDVKDFEKKTNLVPVLQKSNLLKSVTLSGSYVRRVIQEFYCNLSENCGIMTDPSYHRVFVRASLLYKIKHGIPLNLGRIIFEQVMSFSSEKAKTNTNGLPYPLLIFQLLKSQGFTTDAAESSTVAFIQEEIKLLQEEIDQHEITLNKARAGKQKLLEVLSLLKGKQHAATGTNTQGEQTLGTEESTSQGEQDTEEDQDAGSARDEENNDDEGDSDFDSELHKFD
ncbi:unnamed protein product [Cuscuta campestris]|uniref:cytokinin riboside 5'-monophosphate phosphoribohydrolase n=1 Tax=Cuscuta campestris TaxID=132261 RepID=A0A484KSR3_9ASTE|nr:unnamed protein product [Cuscuta campestris]